MTVRRDGINSKEALCDQNGKRKGGRFTKEYVRRAQEKGELKTKEEQLRFLTLALCGVAGELANLMKKMWRGDGAKAGEIRDEIADIRIYPEHLATHLGIDIDLACESKLRVVEERLAAVA